MVSDDTLFLDSETYNETPIKVGAHRYAETAEVLLVPHAFGQEDVDVWDIQDLPDWAPELAYKVKHADRVVIHNSPFDRSVLRHHGVDIPVEKIDDTMLMALQHGLVAKLEQLCEVLALPSDKVKDKEGRRLIQLFTKPRPKNQKLRRATRETHPDDWIAFVRYARSDVVSMRDVYWRLPRWNADGPERALWLLDQAVNDRGVAVDVEFATAAERAFARTSRSLGALAAEITDGAITSTTQTAKLREYLSEQLAVDLPNMQSGTIDAALRSFMPDEARQLLEIRQQAAATSPAKYTSLRNAASSDGRLRGTIQFSGAARTGRDAGRIFQPQNLPRTPDWFDDEVQQVTIDAIKAGAVDILWENVSERCSMAVRGCLVAEEGKKFVISDLSNIEGRVLAWLANEEWKIEAFKAYDRGEGPDLYKVTAGRILGKPAEEVTKDERQETGKVAELACGFAGSVGAFRVMGGERVDNMTDETILSIVHKWRAAHPATKKFWFELERAVRAALKNKGSAYEVNGFIRADVANGPDGVPYLRLRLPSGRYLCYREPEIDEGGECGECHGVGQYDGELCRPCHATGKRTGTNQITYMGMNQYTRKWERLETYYGKLTENVVQAIARDVFMVGLKRAEAEGYPVVLRVHDELVCEVPDRPSYSASALSKLMAANPGWSAGLPLAAAGFEAYRYRKE